MSKLTSLLNEKPVVVADGAWGTELARRGLPAGAAPELWNAERPDEVRAVAASYVAAGSDVILTNTFGGSPPKLAKAGLEGRCDELNRLGAELSKEAAGGGGDTALVIASVGPTGELLEPLGTLTEGDAVSFFARQICALAAGGADGVVMETFIDLAEAKAALRAAKEATDLPAVVSMTFEKGAAGYATVMGVTPERAAKELTAAGADAVGANCGSGIDNMVDVARLLRPATDLPVWIKPNAGMPELVDGRTVFRQTPEEMVARVADLVAAGASVIGGCCGTTPEHIRAIVAEVRRLSS